MSQQVVLKKTRESMPIKIGSKYLDKVNGRTYKLIRVGNLLIGDLDELGAIKKGVTLERAMGATLSMTLDRFKQNFIEV